MTDNLPPPLGKAFRARPVDADKYSVGTVAVVGGSVRYPNAPVMAGLGARAAGAGLVQLVVPDASRVCAGALVPEATFAELGPCCDFPKADVVVAGMGLGPGAEAVVTRLFESRHPRLVLDADALSAIAAMRGRGGLPAAGGREVVLTPHEGEAARLLGCGRAEVSADRLSAAKSVAAAYGATVVLKGPRTVAVSADGARVYVNDTGNPFMALGGMGDLLAGVLGARWAYLKGDPFVAAASAAWLHGAASDRVVAAGRDPSIAATAAEIGAMRVSLDR